MSPSDIPRFLGVSLDSKLAEDNNTKSAQIKYTLKSVLIILKELAKSKDILFVFDDIYSFHRECLSALNNAGHQVKYI